MRIKNNLAKHVNSIHIKDFSFICTICGAKFTDPTSRGSARGTPSARVLVLSNRESLLFFNLCSFSGSAKTSTVQVQVLGISPVGLDDETKGVDDETGGNDDELVGSAEVTNGGDGTESKLFIC